MAWFVCPVLLKPYHREGGGIAAQGDVITLIKQGPRCVIVAVMLFPLYLLQLDPRENPLDVWMFTWVHDSWRAPGAQLCRGRCTIQAGPLVTAWYVGFARGVC